jgi:hypothetical protein
LTTTALQSVKSEFSIHASELQKFTEGWLLDGEIRQHSQTTLKLRRLLIEKLSWFLGEQKIDQCDTTALRQFFAYLSRTPTGKTGRSVGQSSVNEGHTALHGQNLLRPFGTIFPLARHGRACCPVANRLRPSPKDRSEQVKPFSDQTG